MNNCDSLSHNCAHCETNLFVNCEDTSILPGGNRICCRIMFLWIHPVLIGNFTDRWKLWFNYYNRADSESNVFHIQKCVDLHWSILYSSGGTVVSSAGVYPITLHATSGCDSVITTTLIVYPVLQCDKNSFDLPGCKLYIAKRTKCEYFRCLCCHTFIHTWMWFCSFHNALSRSNLFHLQECGDLSGGNLCFTKWSIGQHLRNVSCDITNLTELWFCNYHNSCCKTKLFHCTKWGYLSGWEFCFTKWTDCKYGRKLPCSIVHYIWLWLCDHDKPVYQRSLLHHPQCINLPGSSYTLPGGTVVTSPGSYPVSFQTFHGCDSVITTNLSVNPVFTVTNNVSICQVVPTPCRTIRWWVLQALIRCYCIQLKVVILL